MQGTRNRFTAWVGETRFYLTEGADSPFKPLPESTLADSGGALPREDLELPKRPATTPGGYPDDIN